MKNPQSRKSELWPILLILAVALILRLVLICCCGMMYGFGDDLEYVERAHAVLSGYGFQQIMRPPLFYHFISLLFLIFGPHVIAVGWANIVFHLGSILMLYLISRELYGRRVALWAAAIYAFYIPFVMFVQCGYAINMAVFLFLPALWFFVRFEKSGRMRLLFWAGFFIGISALTYESMIIVTPALLVGIFCICRKRRMRFLKPAASFLIALLLIVGGWTARNYIITRHFVLISINYGNYSWISHNTLLHLGQDYRIWKSVEEPCYYPLWNVEYVEGRRGTHLKNYLRTSGPDPVENARQDLRNALRFVIDHPLITLRRCWLKLSVLWSPSPWALFFLMEGYYGPLSPTTIRTIVLLSVISYATLVLTGVVGMAFSPSSSSKVTFVLIIIIWSAFYSFMHPLTRYRPPFMPIFALYAAYTICQRRAILALKGNRWRWAVVGALVLLFLVLWTPHMRILDSVFREPFPEPTISKNRRPDVAKFLKELEDHRRGDYYQRRWAGSWRQSAKWDH